MEGKRIVGFLPRTMCGDISEERETHILADTYPLVLWKEKARIKQALVMPLTSLCTHTASP